jgi:hypothetical protein
MRKAVAGIVVFAGGLVVGGSAFALTNPSQVVHGPYDGGYLWQGAVAISGPFTTTTQTWTDVPGLEVGDACVRSTSSEVSVVVALAPLGRAPYRVRVLLDDRTMFPARVTLGPDHGTSFLFVGSASDGDHTIQVQWAVPPGFAQAGIRSGSMNVAITGGIGQGCF